MEPTETELTDTASPGIDSPGIELGDAERRVLGCLIEKEMTTPDYYPMTINALLAACNQKSSRFPVVEYHQTGVLEAVDSLREKGLARTVHGKGDRAQKYRHVINDTLHVSTRQAALLAVLLLRGPQTLGELRSRTARYSEFSDLADVTAELTELMAGEEPRVARLGRRPGEKEPRYRDLLGGDKSDDVAPGRYPDPAGADDRIAELERELTDLRARVNRMESELGLDQADVSASIPSDRR